MFAPRRPANRCRRATSQPASAGVVCTASTAAQRTSLEPCLVIARGARWCRTRGGVGSARPRTPAARRVGEPVHVADLGDEHRRQHRADPGQLLHRLIAGFAGQLAPVNRVERRRSRSRGRRSAAAASRPGPHTVDRSSGRFSSSVGPATPNRSRHRHLDARLGQHRVDLRPCSPERSATSLARCRTSSRSSRVAGGAIHASGSRPIRSRSARSAASRTSFFTRRYSKRLHSQRVRQMHPRALRPAARRPPSTSRRWPPAPPRDPSPALGHHRSPTRPDR